MFVPNMYHNFADHTMSSVERSPLEHGELEASPDHQYRQVEEDEEEDEEDQEEHEESSAAEVQSEAEEVEHDEEVHNSPAER